METCSGHKHPFIQGILREPSDIPEQAGGIKYVLPTVHEGAAGLFCFVLFVGHLQWARFSGKVLFHVIFY